MKLKVGRKRQYTQGEIAGVPCARCGAPSSEQFNVCALKGRFVAVCPTCDVILNALVLRDFLELANADKLVAKYRAKKGVA